MNRVRKLPLGRSHWEILAPRRRANVREIRFLGFQTSKAPFPVSSLQIQGILCAAAQNVINLGCQDPFRNPAQTNDDIRRSSMGA